MLHISLRNEGRGKLRNSPVNTKIRGGQRRTRGKRHSMVEQSSLYSLWRDHGRAVIHTDTCGGHTMEQVYLERTWMTNAWAGLVWAAAGKVTQPDPVQLYPMGGRRLKQREECEEEGAAEGTCYELSPPSQSPLGNLGWEGEVEELRTEVEWEGEGKVFGCWLFHLSVCFVCGIASHHPTLF